MPTQQKCLKQTIRKSSKDEKSSTKINPNALHFKHDMSEKAALSLFQTYRVRGGERLKFFS
jgi:hypothetical protein